MYIKAAKIFGYTIILCVLLLGGMFVYETYHHNGMVPAIFVTAFLSAIGGLLALTADMFWGDWTP